jgi:hypothetical protein
MFLRRDGDFAHSPPHGAAGVANRGAKHLRQRYNRHRSPENPNFAVSRAADRDVKTKHAAAIVALG